MQPGIMIYYLIYHITTSEQLNLGSVIRFIMLSVFVTNEYYEYNTRHTFIFSFHENLHNRLLEIKNEILL